MIFKITKNLDNWFPQQVREYLDMFSVKGNSEFEQLVSIISASEFLNGLKCYLYAKNSFMEITKREKERITFIYI
jgi:hypothetical protein